MDRPGVRGMALPYHDEEGIPMPISQPVGTRSEGPETSRRERRKRVRYSVHLIADVETHAGIYTGVVTDLSLGGALLVLPCALGIGEWLKVSFRFHAMALPWTFEARVVRHAYGAEGIEFVDMRREGREALEAWLRLQKERGTLH